jgi:hypothetical protein
MYVTAWGKVLQELVAAQIVKKLTTLCETLTFITVNTTVRTWILS